MKFGKEYELHQIEQWRGEYFEYKAFKKRLHQIVEVATPQPVSPSEVRIGASAVERVPPADAELTVQISGGGAVGTAVEDVKFLEDSPLLTDEVEKWQRDVQVEVERIRSFIQDGLQDLEGNLKELEFAGGVMPGVEQAVAQGNRPRIPSMISCDRPFDNVKIAISSRVAHQGIEDLCLLRVALEQMFDFAEMNHVALYKALKKHDKVLSRADGISSLLPSIMDASAAMFKERFQAISSQIERIHVAYAKSLGQPETLASKTAHVRDLMEDQWRMKKTTYAGYFFCLGTSIALLGSLVVLLCLPALDPETNSMPHFLSPFPIFYSIFWVLFILWCAGFVAQACDNFGINFRYILHVDASCSVNPRLFLLLAAVLTTAWVLTFGAYVVDYKWTRFENMISGTAEARYIPRHGHYPIILFCFFVALLFWPYGSRTYSYRLAVILAVGRCALAPLFAVSFADNIVGDVLTSLVKPLQDAVGAGCYMFASHPHTAAEASQFEESGSVCGDWDHDTVDPVIAALPLFFRSMQCLRRYYDANAGKFEWKRFRHMANFGKYCTSLAVVFVGATQGSKSSSKIVVAALATIYSATWDIKMDFALDWKTVTGQTDEKHQRVFRPITYLSACMADIVLRLVWVLSLFPIDVLVSGMVNRLAFRWAISALELLRRSMWFILRVEHEQDALQLIKNKRDEDSFLFSSTQKCIDDPEMTRALTLRSARPVE